MMKDNPRIPYKKALNPSQLEAVTFTKGPLLVIAGAGSGKTRTLTYRVAHLVEQGVLPSSILLLTFTRKASQEMLKRAANLLDNRCEQVSGGTFHSFAYTILQRYASKIGFDRGLSIIDRSDSEDLINLLRKEMKLTLRYGSFPRKRTLSNIISRSVNKSLSIEDVVLNDYPHFLHHTDAVVALFKAYQRQKAEHHFFDYDDLLVFLKMLLTEHPDIRDRISSFYCYIMVDEYQDTNQIQAEIIYLLAGISKNVMVVGDDSQSIYSFRGASFNNTLFAEYPHDDQLILSTVHSAKGLEWHTVFIIWALDGRFPSVYSLNCDDELEEELRLMYVAATRAKEHLYFTFPMQFYDRHSDLFLNRPSRFIDGIPDDMLEKVFC